jgi:hypothetical protein
MVTVNHGPMGIKTSMEIGRIDQLGKINIMGRTRVTLVEILIRIEDFINLCITVLVATSNSMVEVLLRGMEVDNLRRQRHLLDRDSGGIVDEVEVVEVVEETTSMVHLERMCTVW